MAPLVADVAGDLFGTTNLGGSAGSEGCGTVFKLAPSGLETDARQDETMSR